MSENKVKKIIGTHIPYRWLCSHCNKRWGEPAKNGMIDIKRCAKCPPLRVGDR